MIARICNDIRLSRSLFPTPKGKVVALNGASASTKAAVLVALEPQLADSKTQLVDNYIITSPASSGLIEQELRSVYIEQVLKSADQGQTILLIACLLSNSEGRRDLDNILSTFRGKQVPLTWVDAEFEPRYSAHGCRPAAGHQDTRCSTQHAGICTGTPGPHRLDQVICESWRILLSCLASQ